MTNRTRTFTINGRPVGRFVFWLVSVAVLVVLSPFLIWLGVFVLALLLWAGVIVGVAYVWYWISGKWLFGFEYEETRSEITYEDDPK